MDEKRKRLLELFKERAIAFGKFTLASGKESNYYINSKKAIFHSEAISLVADLFFEMTKDQDIQAVGGLEIGAIPLTAALVQRYHQAGREMEGFFVRKQEKSHGSRGRVEGVVKPGGNIAMLEDVITSGGSVLQAIEEVEKMGAKVKTVLCIVDRLDKGKKPELTTGYIFQPIFTIRDFGIEPI